MIDPSVPRSELLGLTATYCAGNRRGYPPAVPPARPGPPRQAARPGGKECLMQPWVWIIVALIVIAVAALVYWYAGQQKRRQLREHFGSEYDHSVQAMGDERKAQAELARRAERVEQLQI